MKLILLSGGSGKRLWPLSNDARSKQFLKVLGNEQGNLESMVQRVWNQLVKLKLSESTVITTSKSQLDMIQSQLGNDVPLIIEPERRDTFPAIALAATYLYQNGTDLNEIVTVLPVDPYVEIEFFEKIQELESVLKNSNANLSLIGVNPTYPSEKYGYIVPERNCLEKYIKVSHFKEKPTVNEATDLISKGALWNCGVFAFKLGYIISLLESNSLPTNYEELLNNYQNLDKISFDYAVVEKAEKIVVLPYEGSWKDLGTWNTLTEEMFTTQIGKGIISESSTNTHLVNELDLQVTIIGIKDAIVAVSPDGILISDKKESPKIKEILAGFDQRIMYEERRWGWYKVLDYTRFDDQDEVLTKRICVKAGCNISYQKHQIRNEVWNIIRGEGEVAINNEIRFVKSGDVINIPIGVSHGLRAVSELEIIEIQTGKQIIEEDIERIFMTWNEVEKYCKSH